jgi:hypothetical protein
MTANLKSDKYQEKGDLEAQEARVFQDSSLRIEYTPREELYDLALVSLMDTEGKIMLTESEAVETLRQFVDAVADIQEAFSKTMPSHYGTDSALDPKSRKRPGLEKYVLDPGMTRRLLTGFQKERMKQGMALRTFINQSLRRTLEGERVSAQDRKLALMIFARYGFLEGKQTGEELGLDYTDGRFSMAMPSIQERALEQGEAFTTLSQAEVAQLDPYELRKRWSDAEIFEEFGVDVTRETATSERTAEAGEMSLAEAEIIMGSERFFGPADVEVTFGSLPEDVPPLRVTREELEQAKAEGQRLVLYTSRLTGSDLTVASIEALLDNQTSQGEKFLYDSEWYIKDSVLKNETPRTEWRLVADECLPGTSGKNYLEQTEIIAQYVRGHGLPVAYQEVIEEFDQNRENIRDILEGNTQKVPAVVVDLQEAGEKLAKLQVNQLFRERFSEVLYRLALVEKKTGVRLLDNAGTSTYYTWTNSRNADGSLVDVGSLDAFGASVGGRKPVNQSDNLGVAFSRRVS